MSKKCQKVSKMFKIVQKLVIDRQKNTRNRQRILRKIIDEEIVENIENHWDSIMVIRHYMLCYIAKISSRYDILLFVCINKIRLYSNFMPFVL